VSNVAQRSFASGEVAPALYAATDRAAYQRGLRTLRNCIVLRSGGIHNRGGFERVASTGGNAASRIIPFVPSAHVSYVLEFGDYVIRIYAEGEAWPFPVGAWTTATPYAVGDVVNNTDGFNFFLGYCTVAHTSGAATELGVGVDSATVWRTFLGAALPIPSPYALADVRAIRYAQTGNTMTLVHPNYPITELTRSVDPLTGVIRWALSQVTFAPTIGSPTNLALAAGTAAAVWYAMTAVDHETGEESLPTVKTGNFRPVAGTPTTITWNRVANALRYRIYRSIDGAVYGFVGEGGGTPAAVADASWTTATSTVSTILQAQWVAAATQARNPLTLASIADKAIDGKYTVTGTITVTPGGGTSASADGRVRAYYSRDAEPRVDAGVFATTRATGTAPVGPVPFSIAVEVPENGYTALTIDLVPEVYGIGGPSYDTSIACTSVTWQQNNATTFSDNAVPADLSAKPPVARTPFSGARHYPSTVSYYQQRRLFANTIADPGTVWASRIALFRNFTVSSPLQDDDAVTFTLDGHQVPEVEHLADLERLLLFMAASEHSIEGDGPQGIITPTAINPRRLSANGSSALPPLVLNDTALYVQARGGMVRDLLTDGAQQVDGSRGSDLTGTASHLVDGYTIVAWAYQQVPYSAVWAVRSDGVLLCCTYLRESGITGWSRHDTDGWFEDVVCVAEGTEDRVYVIVRRSINGATVRFIERLSLRHPVDTPTGRDDFCFMDASCWSTTWTTIGTLTLTGGTTWAAGESLTMTAVAPAAFSAPLVGQTWFLEDAAGTRIRVAITGYTSATVVTVKPEGPVPATLRGIAATRWASGLTEVTGLGYLEGKRVSVFADGAVIASPNNTQGGYPVLTVTGGSVPLGGTYARARVGLPYLSDVETLDLDTASGPSLKPSSVLVNAVSVYLEKTRGLWMGRVPPESNARNLPGDPLFDLEEMKARSNEDYNAPAALLTQSATIPVTTEHDQHGRVFARQVDPLPLSILAIIPTGSVPPTR
jgi:hypothetical protein